MCNKVAKAEVEGALLALCVETLSNQFSVAHKLTALISNGPDNATEACAKLLRSRGVVDEFLQLARR